MRPVLIIVFAEGFEQFPRVSEIDKLVFVEALVAQLSIEALAVAILRRFAGSDEAMRHLAIVRPALQGQAGKLRPVVGEDAARATRTTRGPDREVSASIHRHSRL